MHAAHLATCSDDDIPLMVAETYPRLPGGMGGGPAGVAANMNTLAFWDQAERVEFYECLPGPLFLYIPCSAQGDGLSLNYRYH